MNNKIIMTRANESFSSQVIACSFILQSLGTHFYATTCNKYPRMSLELWTYDCQANND